MKKLILSVICALPAFAMAQDGFTLSGKVGNLNAPAKIFLTYRSGANAVSDSAELKDGAFKFTGQIPDITSAMLSIKYPKAAGADPKKRTAPDGLTFFLENKNITIASADSVKNAKITGSFINEENAKMKELIKPAVDKVAALSKALDAEYMAKSPEERKNAVFIQSLNDRMRAGSKELTDAYLQYAMAHTDTYIGLVAFRNSLPSKIDDVTARPVFAKFSPAVQNTTLGKNLASAIEAASKTKVGVMAMNFTQNDVNGKPVSLSDFKGKYVLIDFWASWCIPCREENPNVVASYNEFKDKNFTILSVSLDKPGKHEDWLKAIKDDNLTWTHVSDLQFWENAVAKQYGINSIPASFLLDPSGRIIARDLRGDALKRKLAEVTGAQAPK